MRRLSGVVAVTLLVVGRDGGPTAPESLSRAGVCHESVHDILQITDHGSVAFDRCPFDTTGGGDG